MTKRTCILCGEKWVNVCDTVFSGDDTFSIQHLKNDCVLAELSVLGIQDVDIVNKAIEIAMMRRVTLGEIKVCPKATTKEEIENEMRSVRG